MATKQPKTWRDYIKPEQLNADYKMVCDVIGLEATIRLAQALPKIYIYLPSPDKLFLPAKVEYILDRYKHAGPEAAFDYRQIALETGLSIREVYNIIDRSRTKARQQNIFEGEK